MYLTMSSNYWPFRYGWRIYGKMLTIIIFIVEEKFLVLSNITFILNNYNKYLNIWFKCVSFTRLWLLICLDCIEYKLNFLSSSDKLHWSDNIQFLFSVDSQNMSINFVTFLHIYERVLLLFYFVISNFNNIKNF